MMMQSNIFHTDIEGRILAMAGADLFEQYIAAQHGSGRLNINEAVDQSIANLPVENIIIIGNSARKPLGEKIMQSGNFCSNF